MRAIVLPAIALLMLLPLPRAADGQPLVPLRIGTITIRNEDIYSADEARHGAFYTAVDRVHVETRRSVIRGFLLFREGEPYVPARLAETERNLRALGFLKSASVSAGAPHDGLVDVVVATQDAWSLEPGTQAGSSGGVGTWGMSLTDTNLAGFGRQTSFSFHKGSERTRAAFDYRDPAFIRPYWQSQLTYAQNSDGFEHRVSAGRPFYSFETPWSADVAFDEIKQNDHLYDAGRVRALFAQRRRILIAESGLALSSGAERATRLTGGLRWASDAFLSGPGRSAEGIPAARAFHYAFVRLEIVHSDFVKLNYVDKDTRYEDFDLGHRSSAEAAVSPHVGGGSTSTTEFVRIADSLGSRIDQQSFVTSSLSFESRIEHALRNAIFSAESHYVRRFDTSMPQALVARAILHDSRNLDPEVQFFADGGDGLRAYRLHSFAGGRNVLLNVEQRVFLGRELLQIVSPGMALFADAGNATDGPLRDLLKLKTDLGIGLRLGLPRTPRNLLRIDFAYALDRDPRSGRRGLLVSFSSGQAF